MSERARTSARQDLPHRALLSWIVTIPYVVIFISILVFWHPFHLILSRISRRAHKIALDLMNWCIITNIRVTAGARYRVLGASHVPPGRPVLMVSNHQSMYDIPMIMWVCRSREVGFVAKKELGRWIPSISLALRRLGSVLIDRKDAAGSVRQIESFGRAKEESAQIAVIFPEGTRARDGVMRRFKPTGLQALARGMPSAMVQPVAIRGNWQLLYYNFFPVPYGTSVEVEFLEPFELSSYTGKDLSAEVERRIRERLDAPTT